MKVTLYHNPEAGDGEPTGVELVAAFKAAGHEVRYRSTKQDFPGDVADMAAEVVVIAGGDGTLRKVFKQLITEGFFPPILLLSCGTANNLAVGLGVLPEWRDAVEVLEAHQVQPFHYSRLKVDDADDCYFESAGVGLFADFLHLAESDPQAVDGLAKGAKGFTRDCRAMAEIVAGLAAFEAEISDDTAKHAGAYLAVEAMNAPWIGPHLRFGTEEALDPHRIEVAAIAEEEREAMLAYFRAKAAGKEPEFPGTRLSLGEALRIRLGAARRYHADDEPKRGEGYREIVLTRADMPLRILRPAWVGREKHAT